MERLTYRLKTGEVLMATEYEEKYTKDEWIVMLQCCLAAYEDTGLTPEEINDLASVREISPEAEYAINKHADNIIERLDKLLHQTDDDARLRELAEADKDGRLVVLPCKVGDTVYRLFAGNPDNPVIATLKINTVAEAAKLIGKMGMHKYIGTFLTREEAEKALEAMKDG